MNFQYTQKSTMIFRNIFKVIYQKHDASLEFDVTLIRFEL